MSLRQEIETWVSALKHYDEHDYDSALHAFHQIADTSKILFNCGVIHATLGEHGKAIDCYSRSTQLDQYLAIAYFQQGVSNFLTGDFEEALANFNDTLLYLRGNRYIDYAQLGLKFKLHSCEALFNRGLCYFYLQQREAGMSDLLFASREKAVPDHNVIDEAIRDRAEGYTVFSIPVGIVYRPNEAKVKNLRTKDYLGRARLIAQQQNNRPERRQLSAQDLSSSLAFDGHGSYAAMHLVRPGLSSRNRQQSEPPLHRAVFPPTPPPEMERPLSSEETRRDASRTSQDSSYRPGHQRRSSESTTVASQSNTSIRRTVNKPSKLDLGAAAFETPLYEHQATQSTSPNFSKPTRPRISTRSASERPTTRRPAPAHIDTSFSSRMHDPNLVIRSRERLSLLEPSRQTSTPSPTSPVQLVPLSFSHRRSHSSSTITAHTHSGSWTEFSPPNRVPSITEASEPPTPAPFNFSTDTTPISASDASTSISARPVSDASSTLSSSDTPTSDISSGIISGFELVTHTTNLTAPALAAASIAPKTPPLPRRNPSRTGRSPGPHARMRDTSRSLRSGSRSRPRLPHDRDRQRDKEEVIDDLPPPPTVKRIRVKLHAVNDTRYLMISPEIHVSALLELVRTKLGIKGECKVKMRDEEGDFVTIGDGEDWEMCIDMVRRGARGEWEGAVKEGQMGEGGVGVGDKGELGKVDLWVSET
ncbi:hypothetical protein KVT40_000487 [Elsinoe batatas]|uniref:PB1 domain-containing protein n=1 Tax=Elsinoe batatas TaxID=2601811 RepID=A0A8K0L9E2_9PEZI|nr:hypothetical protein KVT40_000487 [Elsinoe batatas]